MNSADEDAVRTEKRITVATMVFTSRQIVCQDVEMSTIVTDPGHRITVDDIFKGSSQSDEAQAAAPTAARLQLKRFYLVFKANWSGTPSGIDILSHLIQISEEVEFFHLSKFSTRDTVASSLSDLIRLLGHATGIVMYAVAAWDDGEGGTQVYEAASDRIAHILEDDSTASMRQLFVKLAHAELGPTFTRELLNAWPCIVGLPEYGYRPWLPPQHPNAAQERIVGDEFFTAVASWQGIVLDWIAVAEDVRSGRHELISADRLPNGLLTFDAPKTGDFRQLALILQFVRLWQRRLQQGDSAARNHLFQFKHRGQPDRFQEQAAVDSKYAYPDWSAIYFAASRKHNFEPSAYMLPVHVERMVTEPARQAFSVLIESHRFSKILDTIEEYQLLNPPEVPSDFQAPLIHSEPPLTRTNLLLMLQNPLLPEGFYRWRRDDSEEYVILKYVKWATQHNGLTDPATGKIYGGYRGALSALVAGVRIAWTVQYVQKHPKLSIDPDCLQFGSDPQRHLADLWAYIESHLKKSIEVSIPPIRPRLPTGTIMTPWPAKNIRWENCMGRSGTDPVETGQLTEDERAHKYPEAVITEDIPVALNITGA
ncbi:hypothetical protein FS749_002812 [Ceratobasidium sp. UAMH 11750]|nr:hypothetical protein FS749_002812 [Ceratobasidium sp. UAMH 11750]